MSTVRRRTAGTHSGRLLLRMPSALHRDLAEAAEREGISLNQLIVGRLSHSVETPALPAQQAVRPVRRRSRLLAYALGVNLAVLLAAAAIAVALLLAAWHA